MALIKGLIFSLFPQLLRARLKSNHVWWTEGGGADRLILTINNLRRVGAFFQVGPYLIVEENKVTLAEYECTSFNLQEVFHGDTPPESCQGGWQRYSCSRRNLKHFHLPFNVERFERSVGARTYVYCESNVPVAGGQLWPQLCRVVWAVSCLV